MTTSKALNCLSGSSRNDLQARAAPTIQGFTARASQIATQQCAGLYLGWAHKLQKNLRFMRRAPRPGGDPAWTEPPGYLVARLQSSSRIRRLRCLTAPA